MVYEAYCIRCRRKVALKNPQNVMMKTNRPAVAGRCPECGTKLRVIVKKHKSFLEKLLFP